MLKKAMDDVYLDKSLEDFPNLHKYWGIHEYDTEHHQIMLEREGNRMRFYNMSPQILHRQTLVDWMKKIAALKKLDNSSIHLAVYVLDVFMDNHNIITDRLYLVALVCLLLATKFEERDIKCLKAEELNKIVNNKYSLPDYYSLEILILKHLNWNLFLPTAVQFVNYYIGYLFTDEDVNFSEMESHSDLWHEGKKLIHEYLDCVISDIHLMQRRPSMVAAAILATTRKDLALSTIWPMQLIVITEFNLFDLKGTILKLRKTLKAVKNNNK